MNTQTQWKSVNIAGAKYLGILEFKSGNAEFVMFDVVQAKNGMVVFGGACNVSLLQSGYIEPESHESLDETLAELLADLQTYYNDGPTYTSRIVCNERM